LDQLPRLYTEDEAAAYLGITPATLARLRRLGSIRHLAIAKRRYRYQAEHLIEYLAKVTDPPQPKPDVEQLVHLSGPVTRRRGRPPGSKNKRARLL